MLLYRLQSHSNFYLHLIVFSLKYLIFGNYLSSHALGVKAPDFTEYFPGDIRYLFAEYIRAYTPTLLLDQLRFPIEVSPAKRRACDTLF